MGEVYRARDTKLNRVIALKTLPGVFASDPDRLARFKREAHVLASLNHPNIAAIYGFEDSGATHALVMELVEGRTLADLVAVPMPIAEALPITRQIASALEAAHEQGIIHRDLKPANIKIADDGTVKVLDFGLAKALTPDPSGTTHGSPSTMTSPAMTELGMILGTAAYMAPEQAKGKPVDRRADLWALGVVLFEMLTGKALYRGETVTETIAHVITQPPAWDMLPASTPASVRRLLRRCLEKDPRNRMQSAGDVRIEIDELMSAAETPGSASGLALPGAAAPGHRRWLRALPWGIAAALLVALLVALWPRSEETARPLYLDTQITTTDDLSITENDGAIAVLSPDGMTLVYVGTSAAGGARRLYVRALDRLEATPLPGTDGAYQPFFSPDGQFVAFFANGNLMRTPLSGGTPTVITSATASRGGAWGPDNTIVFTAGLSAGLSRVPAAGGKAVPLTTLTGNERTHRWPAFLPDGKSVLFICQLADGTYDDGTIEAVRLDTGARTVLIRGGTFPRFVSTGHLLYTRQNTLYAARFDPKQLKVISDPGQPVLSGIVASGSGSGVGGAAGTGAVQFTIASNGTAAYLPELPQLEGTPRRLVIADRSGKVTYEFPEKKLFGDPRFSPDGTRIALRVRDGKTQTIEMLDLARETLTRITFDNLSMLPAWSQDGQQVAFASDRGGKGVEVYVGRSDGTGEIKALTSGGSLRLPTSFSPDDRRLAFMDANAKTNTDIMVVSLADGTITPFLNSAANEMLGVFSPDGRWMAYQSADLPGPTNVFVRSYPDGGGLRQVSSGGGTMPRWSRRGRELTYLDGKSGMNAVEVTPEGNTLALGKPFKLFDAAAIPALDDATTYDVSADGSRFVMLLTSAKPPERKHVTLVFNFFAEIRKATAGK
jgi:serine/threonine-protein kinase